MSALQDLEIGIGVIILRTMMLGIQPLYLGSGIVMGHLYLEGITMLIHAVRVVPNVYTLQPL